LLDKEFQLIPHKVKAIQEQSDEYIPIGVSQVGAPFLWEETKGEGVTVGVIDSGIADDHPDLEGNIADAVDFTGSGDPCDYNGHGTHVSGTIAADNQGKGIVGVAPNAKILSLKALSSEGYGSMLWTMNALRYAIDKEVDVINMSLGGPHLPRLHKLVKEATNKGITVVAASGNEGDGLIFTPEISFPGYYPESVQVGAIDFNGRLAYFSNTNENVDVLAPGVNILSTYPNGQYARLDGTSMATPHISGLIALYKSLGKEIDISKAENKILTAK